MIRYADLDTSFKGRDFRGVGHHTFLTRSGKDIVLVLYSTPILTYHPDDTVTLRAGYWRSSTTKRRLNEWLRPSYRVVQRHRVWYVLNPLWFLGGSIVLFEEGMRVPVD